MADKMKEPEQENGDRPGYCLAWLILEGLALAGLVYYAGYCT